MAEQSGEHVGEGVKTDAENTPRPLTCSNSHADLSISSFSDQTLQRGPRSLHKDERIARPNVRKMA